MFAAAAPAAPRARASRGRRLAYALVPTLLLVLGLGYVAASPYLALQQMKSALQRQSVGELLGFLDRPALRAQLGRDIEQVLRRTLEEEVAVGLQPSFMLRSLTDNAGKSLQEGLDAVLGDKGFGELQAKLQKGPGLSGLRDEVDAKQIETAWAMLQQGLQVRYGYRGLNAFEVELTHPEIDSMRIRLARSGLVNWRIAALDAALPIQRALREFGIAAKEPKLLEGALRSQKFDLARPMLERKAARGEKDADYPLALLLLSGGPTNKTDFSAGLRHLEAAAAQRHLRANELLSLLHRDGVGVPKDLAQATRWMQAAHEIEAQDRLAAAVATLYSRQGRHQEALTWMERALEAPAHLSSWERSQSNREQIVSERKALYKQYADDLRAAASAPGKPLEPATWLKPLLGVEPQAGLGWGPLQPGMARFDLIGHLGFPTRVRGEGSADVFFQYDSLVPHGVSATFVFHPQQGLKEISLYALPEGVGSQLPLVGRTDQALLARTPADKGSWGGQGCPVDTERLRYSLDGAHEGFTSLADIVGVDGQTSTLRVCSNGFVAGATFR